MDSILRFLRSQNRSLMEPATAGDGRETVTAGLPGLSPRDRLAVGAFLEKRHRTDEAVREDERNKATLAKDGDWDTTSLEQQIGRPMDAQAVCQRLKKLNYHFIFEVSNAFPDIMGIYIPDASVPIRNGRRLRHVIGFESGYSPEYTVWHPHATGPKRVTRGWRALILQLAAKGHINFISACRLFQVESGRSSANWQREIGQLNVIR